MLLLSRRLLFFVPILIKHIPALLEELLQIIETTPLLGRRHVFRFVFNIGLKFLLVIAEVTLVVSTGPTFERGLFHRLVRFRSELLILEWWVVIWIVRLIPT